MREYRLFTILYHLLEHQHTTTQALASKCEVSARTILRDLDVMTLHNIPIYTKRGKYGGVYIDPRFVLERSLLSEIERENVRFSLSIIENLLGVNWSSTLAKLDSKTLESQTTISLDLFGWNHEAKDRTQIQRLNEAIVNKDILHITYRNANNIESTRIIHPIHLAYKNYEWYLQAYCTKRESIRVFKVQRIIAVQNTDSQFQDTYKPIDLAFHKLERNTELRLKLQKRDLTRVREAFQETTITHDGSSYYLTTFVKKDRWLYAHLLSLGNTIEIVSPVGLRQEYLNQLRKIIELYS